MITPLNSQRGAARAGQRSRTDGQHNRSPPAPSAAVPALSAGSHGLREPGAHGRIAPGVRLRLGEAGRQAQPYPARGHHGGPRQPSGDGAELLCAWRPPVARHEENAGVDAVSSVATEAGVMGSAFAASIVDVRTTGGRRYRDGRLVKARLGAGPALTRENTRSAPDRPAHFGRTAPHLKWLFTERRIEERPAAAGLATDEDGRDRGRVPAAFGGFPWPAPSPGGCRRRYAPSCLAVERPHPAARHETRRRRRLPP
jgi:hypothetical protein